jgi:hypothetical protein
MHTSRKLTNQFSRMITGKPSSNHWWFAAEVAMALVVIVLLTFTLAALEIRLLGDGSLSALEASC